LAAGADSACLASPQFEESLISAKMEQAAEQEEAPEGEGGGDGEDFLLRDGGDDLDLRCARHAGTPWRHACSWGPIKRLG
jgi:hypothetical protein